MGVADLFCRKKKPVTGSPGANDAVRVRLAEYGDNGFVARRVLHYAYPERCDDPTAKPAVVEALIARGFKVSDAAVNNGLVLEHFHSVAPDRFDIVTAELSAWFAERGWDYDGWECEVIGSDKEDRTD